MNEKDEKEWLTILLNASSESKEKLFVEALFLGEITDMLFKITVMDDNPDDAKNFEHCQDIAGEAMARIYEVLGEGFDDPT